MDSPKCALHSCPLRVMRRGSLASGKPGFSQWCRDHENQRLYSGGIIVAEDDDWDEPTPATVATRQHGQDGRRP